MTTGSRSDRPAPTPYPHRTHPGRRPSSRIELDALTPHALGSLIALYEH
ncbi:MAG: hypothetical protein EBX39_12780, partial [Actinobacteria bacterium]|nr:hypothetical protein [Actinomycetota bacterium]